MKDFCVQQYTFRPLCEEYGFLPMLEKVARLGYRGIETCFFAGFDNFDMTAMELRARMGDMGLELVGNHFSRIRFDGDHRPSFEFIREAGGKYAVYNFWKPYHTLDDILSAAEIMNDLSQQAEKEGITFVYHNHAEEFVYVDGELVMDRMAKELDPKIKFETDVFFIRKQNEDEIRFIAENADRIRLLHLKQIDEKGENVDLADGVIDMKAVIETAKSATHFILEQTSFPVSIMDSLEKNAALLKNL